MLEGKRRGLIGDVDLRLFSIPTEEPTKIYLSENDIRTMKDLDLSDDKTMELARDIFLMGCYTGQRISDYNRLSGIDIVEKDGVHFFEDLQITKIFLSSAMKYTFILLILFQTSLAFAQSGQLVRGDFYFEKQGYYQALNCS